MNNRLESTDIDPRPGDVVEGRFKILRRLGAARAGWRWLAEQQPLGRTVELVLLDPIAADSDATKRFEREATALCKLAHPNVLQVYDRGTWRDRPFLVTEHVDGGTLADLLEEGPMDPSRLLALTRQIASALGEAHDLGFIHRDVRPESVRVVANGADEEVVRVVDFGLVMDLGPDAAEITEPGSMVGSVAYMAPEQIRGGYVDRRADIYGLGVLLYRGLTGHLPFRQSAGNLLDAQLNEAPPPFSADTILPPVIEWTVRVCLEKDPQSRFASMADLGSALRACMIALVDPPHWNVTLRLDNGHTIAPSTLGDLSSSWSSSYHTPAPVARAAAPAPSVANTNASTDGTLRPTPGIPSPAPTEERRGAPWVVIGGIAAALLFVLGLGGVLAAGAGAGLFAASQGSAEAHSQPSPAPVEPTAALAVAPPPAPAPAPAPEPAAAVTEAPEAPAVAVVEAAPASAAVAPPARPNTEPRAVAPKGPVEATPPAVGVVVAPPITEAPVAPPVPVEPTPSPVVEPPKVAVVEPPSAPEKPVATASAAAATTTVKTFPASAMKAKRQIPFTYPEAARRSALGDVDCKVRVVIDASGVPNRVEPVACTEPFVAVARETLLKWRWEPALVEAKPVAAQFQMLVRFTD